MTSKTFQILLLEDERSVALRLGGIIQTWPSGLLLPPCHTVGEALEIISRQEVDILIADLQLPDGFGTQAIRALRSRQPDAVAIVMSVLNDSASVLDAIRAGATGYLEKDDSAIGIIKAMEMAVTQQSPMSASIARLIVQSLHEEPPKEDIGRRAADLPFTLTKRERDVLTTISRGFSNAEVAEMLGMSPQTVPVHTRNIYRKLQVSNKTEAIYLARREGWIP